MSGKIYAIKHTTNKLQIETLIHPLPSFSKNLKGKFPITFHQ